MPAMGCVGDGLSCCSEPEAAALLGLARAFKPHVWMNAHSGMEALFMPYDHLPHIPTGDAAQATLQARLWTSAAHAAHPDMCMRSPSVPAPCCGACWQPWAELHILKLKFHFLLSQDRIRLACRCCTS